MNNTKKLAAASVIAAAYAAITILLAPISFGGFQIRVSELMTVLPCYTNVAIPGLFVGCIISNIVGMSMGLAGFIDVFVGSIATLIAAFLTYKLRSKRLLALLPPVLINAVMVGAEIAYLSGTPFWINFLSVGAGQMISCYVLGYPLSILLDKQMNRVFK